MMKYAVKLPTEIEIKRIITECQLGNHNGKLDVRFVIDKTLSYVKAINSGYKEWPSWAHWATMDQDKSWCLWKKQPRPNINAGMWELNSATLHWDYVVVMDEVLGTALTEACDHIRWHKCIMSKQVIASTFPIMETIIDTGL